MLAALALDPDEDEDQLLLQHAVRKLCLALICQQVGSTPFQSPNREATSIWAQIPGGERILPTQNAVGAETRGLKYQFPNTNF